MDRVHGKSYVPESPSTLLCEFLNRALPTYDVGTGERVTQKGDLLSLSSILFGFLNQNSGIGFTPQQTAFNQIGNGFAYRLPVNAHFSGQLAFSRNFLKQIVTMMKSLF